MTAREISAAANKPSSELAQRQIDILSRIFPQGAGTVAATHKVAGIPGHRSVEAINRARQLGVVTLVKDGYRLECDLG